MIRLSLFGILLLLVRVASAQVWTQRPAVPGIDAPALFPIRNAAVAGNWRYEEHGTWTEQDALAYLMGWDASRACILNGVVRGIVGSLDWTKPGRAAIVAPVDFPFIDPGLPAAQRLPCLRWLLRGLVTQMTTMPGQRPSHLTFYLPLTVPAAVQDEIAAMGCQTLSQPTVDGEPVLSEIRCDVAALDAALRARGIE